MPLERTEDVRWLQEHGCSVLCLGCPEGMLFGIDYAAWAVGPRFMGVKLVPPGLHYVYCSASAEDVGVSRSGFFAFMKTKDVIVVRWDPQTEELVPLESEEEATRFADGVRAFDFDRNLGPYPVELGAQWSELSRHITAQLVVKIEPVSRLIRSKRAEYDQVGPADPELQPDAEDAAGEAAGDEPQPMDEDPDEGLQDAESIEGRKRATRGQQQQRPQADQQMQHQEGQQLQAQDQQQQPQDQQHQQPQQQKKEDDLGRLESNVAQGCLFFSNLPRARKAKGATPEETTHLHMDRSAQLEAMIDREYAGNELGVLGELQLAYIAFLLGQNYDGFEQWRALLRLLGSCEAAVAARPRLFEELCRTFFAQLSQAPSDLFGDDLTKDNFLGSCALSLLEICDSEEAPARLRKRCGKLRELVQMKFGISVEDLALLGEDAPQIVDAEGRDLIDLSSRDLTAMD